MEQIANNVDRKSTEMDNTNDECYESEHYITFDCYDDIRNEDEYDRIECQLQENRNERESDYIQMRGEVNRMSREYTTIY